MYKYSCDSLCCLKCFYGFKEELKCKNFGFEHDKPKSFVTSQYGHSAFYPIWTTLFAVYHVAWFLLDTCYFSRSPKYLIFLTNWGYTIMTCYCVYNCIVVFYVQIKRKDILKGDTKQMTWYLRLLWILYNIMNSMALGITFAFYVFLTPEASPASIEKHALNTVYVIINVFVTAMPIRLYHFYQPMIIGVLYLIFSVIYQIGFTNKAIYPVLDWTNITSTIPLSFGLVFIGLPLFHTVLFCLYKLRVVLSNKICTKSKRALVELQEL